MVGGARAARLERRSVIEDEHRGEARRHIDEHARGEAERIARLSRIREFVLGFQDGLLVPLGVVTGMAAAEAVAGCIAMGGGSYLASEAEEALYAAEIRDEGQEVVDAPEREVAELALVLEDEGLPRADAERVATGLAANPNVFLRTKTQKELGCRPRPAERRRATRCWSASPTSPPRSCRSGPIPSCRSSGRRSASAWPARWWRCSRWGS
ncbi:MAG TPA: VIT1/CCC1 transporter family protein [Gaiellaceae bacterium]|nr:VIT1/CCC1 transporter family protein [Gaiellaceae bacterium]